MNPLSLIFIGLRDYWGDNKLTNYRWMSDDSQMTYSNFRPAEPSDLTERCGAVWPTAEWNDKNCDYSGAGVLCEANPVNFIVLWLG